MDIRLFSYKLDKRQGLIININEGWGEISPLPGFSRETFEEARTEILSLIPRLAFAKPTLPSVQFGLACALTPFSLSSLQIPLCSLGAKPGFSHHKLKLGRLSLNEAIELVQQHKTKRLRLDFNRKWPLDQLFAFTSRFAPTDFEYLEEPAQTFSELLEFSQKTHFPIAIDESFFDSSWQKIPTIRALIVKPTLHGTIPTVPYPVVLSSSFESGIGLLHIARHWKGPLPIGLDTVFSDDLLHSPILASSGQFSWKGTGSPVNLSKLCRIL